MIEVTKQWLTTTAQEAAAANHVWPEMAACEAGLESAFGTSKLAKEDNNLFGMKTHVHETYGVAILPTREYLDGKWEVVDAAFVKYATLEECFEDRMDTLYRLKSVYPHYAAALSAQDESRASARAGHVIGGEGMCRNCYCGLPTQQEPRKLGKRLNARQLAEIRAALDGETQLSIAERYDADPATISRIKTGEWYR